MIRTLPLYFIQNIFVIVCLLLSTNLWAQPEIDVRGNGVSIVDNDITPSATDHTILGSVQFPGGSITRTYTILNTGTSNLTITSIALSGGAAADFSLGTLTPASPILAGTSATFTITFNPSASGNRDATLTILSNDGNEATYNFTIRGIGLVPEINVVGNAVSIADNDITPTTTDHTGFGTVTGAFTRTYTIQNTGTGTLTITSITGTGDFVTIGALSSPSPLAAGTSATFTVTFIPSASGVRTGTITIINDDSNEGTYDFAVNGTANVPEINVTGNSNTIADGDITPVSTDFTDFGDALVAGGTVVRTFVIQNTGNTALNITSIVGTGDFATIGALTPASPIAVGSSASFTVTFNPSAAGTRTGTITINNNDPNEAPYDFAVQGNGLAPEINVRGGAVTIVDGDATPSTTDRTDFGYVLLTGATQVRTFTIQNTGNMPLTISSIIGTGDFATVGALTPASPIAVGGSATFTVTFDPSALGLRTGSITIINDDEDEATYDFAVQGNGSLENIIVLGNNTAIADGDVSPSTTDFTDFGGALPNSGTVNRTFTIRNIGSTVLTINSITVSGDFTVVSAPTTIAAGSSANFVIRFAPTTTGTLTGTVTINNSDPSLGVFDFMVQGLGMMDEITVQGNISNIVDGDVTPSLIDRTDFDFALIGGAKVHTFSIKNTGFGPLTVTSITGTGDFATIGALSPASPIAAGQTATFTVTFSPTGLGQRTGTITINNSDADEGVFDFMVQGNGVLNALGSWDPLTYPTSSTPCSWAPQDANTTSSPVASWGVLVGMAEAAGTNAIITLQPDAYIGSFDYDNTNGNESCLGHAVSATLDLTAAQNGMTILGSSNACGTFIELSSGAGTDTWANFTGMNGLTLRNLYLREWGKAFTMTNCQNVLVEDCVFENCNTSVANGIDLSGCAGVTFRRCKFLGNTNAAGRAVNITNSGTAGSRITFEDCEFGCNGNQGSGSAIQVSGGSFVAVNGGTISGNSATTGGRGGAINVLPGGDLRISNARFMDNTASSVSSANDGGGAIFVDGNSSTSQTTVVIDGCNFYRNTTTGTTHGAAIACIGNSTNVARSSTTITNCFFEMNGSAGGGGAVLASNATVVFNNNYFLNNQSAALTNSNNTAGGALYFRSAAGNYTITNNTFTENRSASGTAINYASAGATFVITGNLLSATAPVQTLVGVPANSGGTAGCNFALFSSVSASSLAGVFASFDCGATGSYCSATLPDVCLANAQSSFICSPPAASVGNISGQVWSDANGDGVQAATDLGIAGAFVLLYDEMGYLIGRTNADASGNYTFNGVPPGNYSVVFVNPNIGIYDYMSPANAGGSTEPTDSDQASETIINSELRGATSGNVVVVANATTSNVDAGFTTIFLPLELLYFNGKNYDCASTNLYWATAYELNSRYFVVEISEDGIHYESLEVIDAAGTSNDEHYYEWENTKRLGSAYYRLKMVDWDGSYKYSNVIFIESGCKAQTAAQIYPNPADTEVNIRIESNMDTDLRIVIYNALGQPVYVQNVQAQTGMSLFTVPTAEYAAGAYWVQITNLKEQTQVNRKLILE